MDLRPLHLLLASLLIVIPASSAHNGWTHCGVTDVVFANDTYLVIDSVGPNAGWAFLYIESNGIADLQRGAPGDSCNEAPQYGSDTGVLLI